MIRSRLLSTIIILLSAAMQRVLVHANRNNAVMELVPFSIEYRSSSYSSSNTYGINQIILDITTDHLNNFVASKEQAPWNSFEAAILLKYPKSSFTNLDNNQNQQQEQTSNGSQILMTQFSGSISFNNDMNLPTRDELGNIQWEAFTGQAKLNYISILRSQTSFDLLQNITDIKITWTPTSSTSSIGTILVSTLVGILSAGAIVCVFFLIQKFRSNQHKSRHNREHNQIQRHSKKRGKDTNNQRHVLFNDLELAETGSLSPTSFVQGDFVAPTFVDETDSIRMGKTVVTKDTIDVDTGVDMLAWKNRAIRQPEPFELDITRISKSDVHSIIVPNEEGRNANNSHDAMASRKKKKTRRNIKQEDKHDTTVPFDADITRISKFSPNKTLVIDLRPMKKSSGKSKKSSSLDEKSKSHKDDDESVGYLSREVLSRHNEMKYQDHARRYAERKMKTTTSGSRHRYDS